MSGGCLSHWIITSLHSVVVGTLKQWSHSRGSATTKSKLFPGDQLNKGIIDKLETCELDGVGPVDNRPSTN